MHSFAQEVSETTQQKTWTYTYLKAKENEKDNLKEFLIKNWFSMDSIAVRQGLFNDYKLLENTNADRTATWDFIVAVEYFTKNGYSDIAEEWQEIRKAHETILIDGKNLKDLGKIVKSETLIDSYKSNATHCNNDHLKLLKPFLGEWHEYLVTEEGEQLYGKLKISIDDNGCSVKKQFQHLQQPFSYATLGYFDSKKKKWIETYTFSNGAFAIYEWNQDGEDFLLQITESSFGKRATLSRNRWKIHSKEFFQIIVEQSKDDGKTWQVSETTNMRRIH
jgi:hypothetical protein